MCEQFYNKQLRGISEESASHLSSNGIVMSCMRELAEVYEDW